MKTDLVEIGKLGKSIGLKGEIKLHLSTDFPESIKKNSKLYIDSKVYSVDYFIIERNLLKLKEINDIDRAKELTNKLIYMSKEDTLESCKLDEDEYFWFDLEGASVYENELLLGKIGEIDRFGNCDYLMIKTDTKLTKNYPKTFLIPYIERYVINFDKEEKKLFVKDCLELLANS